MKSKPCFSYPRYRIGLYRSISSRLSRFWIFVLGFCIAGPASALVEASTSKLDLRDPSATGASWLVAQADDESYDPFADFSEYDDSEQEEADVHFFRQGRFLTLSTAFGQRVWTGNLSRLYGAGSSLGIFMTYFFDFRFAVQIGLQFGDHAFEFAGEGTRVNGSVSMSFIPINLKYYWNTQNIYKGLADINPYIMGGFSQVYRTYTVAQTDGFGRDGATSYDFGAGVEVPALNRKAFAGIQWMYHYLNFKDRNSQIILPDGTPTNARPNGDTWDLSLLIGFNF